MTEQPGNPTDPIEPDPATPSDAGAVPPPPPPPPAAPAQPPPAPAAGRAQYDFSQARTTLEGAHKFDLGIMAAGVVVFLAGFMPFYTISAFGGSASWSAWHGFFGWFGVLCALAGAVILAVTLFANVALPFPVYQGAVAAFGLSVICLILALFVNPLPSCGGACSSGHGFGYWLALIVALAGLGLSVMRMRESSNTGTTTA